MLTRFERDRALLDAEYDRAAWSPSTGADAETLAAEFAALDGRLAGEPKPLRKAKLFAFLCGRARLSVDPFDLFCHKLEDGELLVKQRDAWAREVAETSMEGHSGRSALGWARGAYIANYDFGHTAPDWYAVLRLGLGGLRARLQSAREAHEAAGTLTPARAVYYDAAAIGYDAVAALCRRYAAEALRLAESADAPYAENLREMSACLAKIADEPPETTREAVQLMALFMRWQEMEGERVRSLGGLDRELFRFYERDAAAGATRDELLALFRYFLNIYHASHTVADQPCFLGGVRADGTDATNELTYLILEAYSTMGVHSPKLQIRVHPNTPDRLVRTVCGLIRGGVSSFCFLSDAAVIPGLLRLGEREEDAREYIPIGCYEPSAMGKEIACTCNGFVNLAKCVELALANGCDLATGERLGAATGVPGDYGAFVAAVKAQIAFFCDEIVETVSLWERHYMELNPAPLFSGTYADSVERGLDVYEGGAAYNHSSVNCMCLASAADALLAVKRLVYDEKRVTLGGLTRILAENWAGNEALRRDVLAYPDRYGNGLAAPDALARELTDSFAARINGRANGRGGSFRAGMFSIDYNHIAGRPCAASADGRLAGAPFSKNSGSVTAMDRGGITTLMRSAARLDYAALPNGSVLDMLLHPSAVSGEAGLDTMVSLVRTYFALGGFAVHGNVFDAAVLRRAQEHPEQYATLQVRVCGWNVYWVNLSRAEQDEFIRQAENTVA